MSGVENIQHRCPNCGAPSSWQVDECDTCGYESKTLRRWRREARRQKRREEREGCLYVLFDATFYVDGIVELAALAGRGVMLLVRGIVGYFT